MDTPDHRITPALRFGWPEGAVILGLLLACAACAASRLAPAWESMPWVALLAGVFLAALGTNGRPSSAAVLIAAGLTAFVASCAVVDPRHAHAGWDSVILVLRILALLAWVAGLLVCASRPIQQVAVSAIILFHFGGIVCAALSAPPSPWIVWALQERVYHHYLHFLHLTNAYRFYAPEFGSSTLLWFRIEYAGDDERRRSRWVRVPDFDGNQVPRQPDGGPLWPPIRYVRRLSLSDGLYYTSGQFTPDQVAARVRAGQQRGIPLHPDMALPAQYAPLVDWAWPTLREYVRHVARTYRHPDRPELPVASIKVYRCLHFVMDPKGILNGWDASDPTRIAAYYLGAFDEDGRDIPYFQRTVEGTLVAARDPFRFWAIPILRRDESGVIVDPSRPRVPGARYDIHDYTVGHGELEVYRP
jgi:hypothetical protein